MLHPTVYSVWGENSCFLAINSQHFGGLKLNTKTYMKRELEISNIYMFHASRVSQCISCAVGLHLLASSFMLECIGGASGGK